MNNLQDAKRIFLNEAESAILLRATELRACEGTRRTLEIGWGSGELFDTPENQWARNLIVQARSASI
jgi:hypothetical protein